MYNLRKTPKYLIIKEHYMKEITSGRIREAEMLPSERSISETFHVSRMTARKAVNCLVQEGYAVRKSTRGTFANRNRLKPRLFIINEQTDFLDPHSDTKPEVTTLNRELVECPPWLAAKMNIDIKGRNLICHLIRSYSYHNEVLFFDEKYIKISDFPGIEKCDFNHSLLKKALFSVNSDPLQTNEVTAEVWNFDDFTCANLQLPPGSIGVRCRARHLDQAGNLVILSRTFYRYDTVCLTLNYKTNQLPLVKFF